MESQFSKLSLPTWTVPLALLVMTSLTYGPQIPWLGFYWDDWPYLWVYHISGPAGFPAFVAHDRPYSYWIFNITTSLFGENALPYHLLALSLRWLAAVLVWAVLRLVWPAYPRPALWAALLFAVYPGFKQQPIALIYNHHLSVLVLFFFSLALMLWSLYQPRRYWPLTGFALLAASSMFSLEYYVGLELLRPVFIWIVLDRTFHDRSQRVITTLQKWAPYLLLLLGYLVWRVFMFQFPTYQPKALDLIAENPLQGLKELVFTILSDFLEVTFGAWWYGLSRAPSLITELGRILLVVLVAVLVFFYLTILNRPRRSNTRSRGQNDPLLWALQALPLGLLALFLAGWPVWITTLPVHLTYPYDRMTIPFMLGVSLVIASLITIFIRPWLPQRLIITLLVGLAVAQHVQNANSYRYDLERFRAFFWQLSWRAPGLQPGTIVVTHKEPFDYYSDNSLTAPLNYVYAPDFVGSQNPGIQRMPYVLFNVEVRTGRGLPALERGLPVYQDYRSLEFVGSSDDILVIYQRVPGCLRVLDPFIQPSVPGLTPQLEPAVPLSDLSQILVDPAQPSYLPEHIFGPEPVNTWCYYFEQADLARQQGDWTRVAELGNQAFALESDQSDELSEYLVFIEGYAHLHNWVRARQLTSQLAEDPELASLACTTWERIGASMTLEAQEAQLISEVKAELECP